jgi:hypothetical protein
MSVSCPICISKQTCTKLIQTFFAQLINDLHKVDPYIFAQLINEARSNKRPLYSVAWNARGHSLNRSSEFLGTKKNKCSKTQTRFFGLDIIHLINILVLNLQ